MVNLLNKEAAWPLSLSARLHRDAATWRCLQDLDKKLEELIQEAKELCESGASGECAALWDNIEEISAEAAHKKVREKDTLDPLEKFCNDNPETDECRTYED